MPKQNKTKLQNLKETNAKDYYQEAKDREQQDDSLASNTKKPRKTIDEIMGYTGKKKLYDTENLEEYREFLMKQNLIELQHECTRVSILPKADKPRLIDNLCRAFTEYYNKIRPISKEPVKLKITQELENTLKRINF